MATAWRRERSFRSQAWGALAMLATLIVVSPAPVWWALALASSLLVLALELVNGAVEELADLVHPDPHPAVARAKDLAAGAVILGSLTALVVGVAMILDTLVLS